MAPWDVFTHARGRVTRMRMEEALRGLDIDRQDPRVLAGRHQGRAGTIWEYRLQAKPEMSAADKVCRTFQAPSPWRTLDLGRYLVPWGERLYRAWWCTKRRALPARAALILGECVRLGTNLGVDGDISGCDMAYRQWLQAWFVALRRRTWERPEEAHHRRPGEPWVGAHRLARIQARDTHRSGEADNWAEHVAMHLTLRTHAWALALGLPVPDVACLGAWPVATFVDGDDGLDMTPCATPAMARRMEDAFLASGFRSEQAAVRVGPSREEGEEEVLYMWAEEKKNWREADKPQDHIYHDLKIIDKFIFTYLYQVFIVFLCALLRYRLYVHVYRY